MNIWQFMSDSPWLTFFLAIILVQPIIWPFKLVNRWIRHRNIVAKGWPPEHLDADGDFKSED